MEKYLDETIEFEYPSGFKVEKYSGGYGICKGKHGLVIDILLVSRVEFAPGNGPEDLLEKHDMPYCRRTVLGEVQYGDKKAFVQYFMKYRDDKFLGKAAQLLFKENIKSPLFVRIQSRDDYDIEEFRPLLESIKIKDVSAFSFKEPMLRRSKTKGSMPIQVPDEIKHLQPIIQKLMQFDPDDLNEDNEEAIDFVGKATEKVLKRLSQSEAIETIKNHIKAIQKLLKQPDMPKPQLAFIQGTLTGMLAFKYNDYSTLESD